MQLLRKSPAALAALLVAAHLALVAVLAWRVPFTSDEPGYLLAGHAIVSDWRWDSPQERLQGPLGYLANQLFVGDFEADGLEDLERVRFAGRLGMLPFALVMLLAVWGWAREAWGARGGLLALFVAAASPTLLGYGALVAVDNAFAATTVLTLWLLWRWLRAPSIGRLAAWSVALGLMLSTKYLALLIAASIPLIAGIAAVRQQRAVRAALALVAAGALALVVLHATYGFRAGLFDAADHPLQSPALRAVDSIPVLGHVLGLLPEPMVCGADYQAVASRDFSSRFMELDRPHWAYFAVTLGTKTPLPTLILLVLGLVAALRARVRWFGLCAGLPAAVLLGYLSFVSALQLGIRYVLPLYPLIAVTAGAWLRGAEPLGRVARAATAALCVWLVAAMAFAWPHGLGYFNVLAGGPAGGYRFFTDSNVEWGQTAVEGRAVLAARHPGLEFLTPSDGPRFGTLAVYTPDLGRRDPENPGRLYHWARRFEPVDSYAAAWLVLDLEAADFERAARSGDRRAARDLAFAHVHAGDLDAARRALELAGDGPRVEALRELLALFARIEAGADGTARRRAVLLAYEADRADLAFALIRGAPDADRTELFSALFPLDPRGAVELLQQQRAAAPLSVIETLLLAGGLYELGEFEAAWRVLETGPRPPEDDPLAPMYAAFRERVDVKHRAMKRLQGR